MRSWNIDFFKRWVKILHPKSVLTWRNYELKHDHIDHKQSLPKLIELDLHHPIKSRIYLRSLSSDIGNFKEIIDECVYESVVKYANGSKSVIDLGSNIGLSVLYFAATIKNCQIFAVEPDHENLAILTKNLRSLTENKRCRILHGAVWDANEKLIISENSKDLDFWGRQVEKAECSDFDQRNSIPGFTIDKIIEQSGFSNVGLLKIDIEGAETNLFRGNTEWLRKINVIAIEFHNNSRIESDFDLIMSRYNFKIVESNYHTVIAVNTDHSVLK
jgi:FkbM family methyltransferase